MSDHSLAAYRHVSLDLSSLNKRGRKKSSRTLGQHPIREANSFPYGSDFNIQNSWVNGQKTDMLRDSMLSYTKRMSDIRRIRGIQTLKHSQLPSNSTGSLWINTGKGSLELNMVEEGNTKKYYNGPQGRVSRSLGTIKLEPLLGSQKVHNSTIIDNNTLLQTHRVEKDHHQPIPPSNHEKTKDEPVKVRHITVTITIPPPEEDEDEEELTETEPQKKKLIPLGSGRARPRKAKRMKIAQPSLEAIDENLDETLSSNQESIEEEYNHLLSDVHRSHENMLQQKRKTVALLRKTNYAQRTNYQNRQLAMASLAKRKLRMLPPIPTGRPSLRYTTSNSGSNRTLFSDSNNLTGLAQEE